MNRFFLIFIVIIYGCDTGNLNTIMDIPMELREVSGLAIDNEQNIFWMVNDSGNKPILYGLDENGAIIKEINIRAKNRDWEDLTVDNEGNIYIGNFGNNTNDSKNLSILKISKDSLNANLKFITPEKISFTYPNQTKFPPKRDSRYFDCESMIFFKDSLYIFTKSRSSNNKGKTNLYQLPSKKGKYKAKHISTFNTCDENSCWVTSADINDDGSKIALLTENSVFIFSNFNTTDFFKSEMKRYSFNHISQKESVCFKNDSTLYIADEYLGISGGNLYEFSLK